MFYHAYRSYMDNAFPADELMPLSCQGRYRGITPSRGDMDDILGKYVYLLDDVVPKNTTCTLLYSLSKVNELLL